MEMSHPERRGSPEERGASCTYPGPPLALHPAGAQQPSARGGGPAQLGPAWGGDRCFGDPLAAHGERVEWERGGCGLEPLPP